MKQTKESYEREKLLIGLIRKQVTDSLRNFKLLCEELNCNFSKEINLIKKEVLDSNL